MMHIVLSLDQSVLDYLYSVRAVPVTFFFIAVSEFGRYQSILAVSAALSALLFIKRRYADIVGLVFAVLGSGATILALKYLVHRPRPALFYQAYTEGLYLAFPSAHAGLSVAFYGFLAYMILQSYPTLSRRVLSLLLPVLAVLVGLSRLYLGVHYLSDVLTGFAIGAVFVWLAIQVRLHMLAKSWKS